MWFRLTRQHRYRERWHWLQIWTWHGWRASYPSFLRPQLYFGELERDQEARAHFQVRLPQHRGQQRRQQIFEPGSMLQGECGPKGVREDKGVSVNEDEHGCCRDRRCVKGVRVTTGCLDGQDGGAVVGVETSVADLRRHGREHVSRNGLPW